MTESFSGFTGVLGIENELHQSHLQSYKPNRLSHSEPDENSECPHGVSNPGFGLERATSWATRRWGPVSANGGILP